MRQLSEQLDIKMVQRDSLGHLGFHAAEFGGQVHFVSEGGGGSVQARCAEFGANRDIDKCDL